MFMIQPINLSTSYNSFKSANDSRARKNPQNNSRVAMYNAIGISATAGGLTTLVARSYTNSFANAGVLGLFGAFLTMFFMTPHLIEKFNMEKAATKKYLAEPQVTKNSKNSTNGADDKCVKTLRKPPGKFPP